MMCRWEAVLGEGQGWDWFDAPYWKARTPFVLFVLAPVAPVYRELTIPNPVVDFRPPGERCPAASNFIFFCAQGVLQGTGLRLLSLFGRDAFVSGL